MLTAKSKAFQKPEKIVITLHGYGSSGEDFFEPIQCVMSSKMQNTLFIFPDAPYECEAGFGREWFKLSNSITFAEIRLGLDSAGHKLFHEVIMNIAKEFNIGTEHINLIGFSQGAILALEMIYYANFAHIVAYSGFFAFDSRKEINYKHNNILMIHGDDDPVVPYSNMKISSENLSSIGIKHETCTCYGIGHSISEEGFEKGVEFIMR